MKRKQVFWLFGSLTLALAGYVGWCTHWLWMDAPVPELLEIPAEYREDAKELVVAYGLTKAAPPALSWSVVWFALQQPYRAAKLRSRVQVITPWKDGSKLVVMGFRPDRDDTVLTFRRVPTGWNMVAERKSERILARGLEKR